MIGKQLSGGSIVLAVSRLPLYLEKLKYEACTLYLVIILFQRLDSDLMYELPEILFG